MFPPPGGSSGSDDSAPLGIIIGAVGACIAAILAAILALLCIRHRRSPNSQSSTKSSQESRNEARVTPPGRGGAEGGLGTLQVGVEHAPTEDSAQVKPGSMNPPLYEGYGDQVPGSTGAQSSIAEHGTMGTMGSLDALSESQSDPSAVRSDSRPGVVRSFK